MLDLAEAEDLAARIAPELDNLRIVMNDPDWPQVECRAGASRYTPSWIRGDGPDGPCIVFNEEPTAEILAHELSHVLPFRRLDFIAASKPSLTFERAMWRVAEVQGIEPWVGHGVEFIRRALHLLHRAELAGCDVRLPLAMIAGGDYGLSGGDEYKMALGIETHTYQRLSFAEIEAVEAPKPFLDLWRSDTQTEGDD